jgi:GABA permease
MLFQEAHRVEILATGLLSLLVVAAGLFVARRRRNGALTAAVAR